MVLEIRIGSDNDGGSKNSNISTLKKMYSSGKPIFMLLRKDRCPPCEDTKPEWLKITHSNDVKPLDIVVADVEEQSLNALSFMKPSVNIVGFPTMFHVENKKIHPYEGGRDVNSFVNWIKNSTFKKGGAKSRGKSTFKKGGAKSRGKSTVKKSTFKKGGTKSRNKRKSKSRTKRRRRVKY